MAIDGRPDVVKLLLDAGAAVGGVVLSQVFLRYRRGRWTDRHNQCIELLIGAGIDVNAVIDHEPEPETVLDVAQYVRNKKLIRILEDAGAE